MTTMSEKRAREEQTSITLFLSKKPMTTSNSAEPFTSYAEQIEPIELPNPERQSIEGPSNLNAGIKNVYSLSGVRTYSCP